jgi:hypothetical protein
VDDPGTKEPRVFGVSRFSDTSSENDYDGNLASTAKDIRAPVFSTQRGVDWVGACKPIQAIGIVKSHQSYFRKIKSGAEGVEETGDDRALCSEGECNENGNNGDESLDAFEEGKPDEVSMSRVLLPGSLGELRILAVTPVPTAGTVEASCQSPPNQSPADESFVPPQGFAAGNNQSIDDGFRDPPEARPETHDHEGAKTKIVGGDIQPLPIWRSGPLGVIAYSIVIGSGDEATFEAQETRVIDPYGEKGQYTGIISCSSGMPHGFGRLEYDRVGRWYEGDWHHGRCTGHGNLANGDGDYYEGGLKNDQKHGHGIMRFADGRVFEGEYIEGRMTEGKMSYQDGSTYEGSWADGMRNGCGRCVFSDQSTYEGEFWEGEFSGFGKMMWSDGGWYEGEWRCGEMCGRGKEVRPDASLRHDGLSAKGAPVRGCLQGGAIFNSLSSTGFVPLGDEKPPPPSCLKGQEKAPLDAESGRASEATTRAEHREQQRRGLPIFGNVCREGSSANASETDSLDIPLEECTIKLEDLRIPSVAASLEKECKKGELSTLDSEKDIHGAVPRQRWSNYDFPGKSILIQGRRCSTTSTPRSP